MVAHDRFARPTNKEAATIRRAIELISAFREISPGMPTGYVAAFLAVAHEPGHGVTKYAKDLDVIVPVASRTLLEIGKKARTGGPGYGLVDSVQASEDLRAWAYYLTPKGVTLLDRVLEVMDRPPA
jgi:DNA-binding MarR family transcriptional regulator